MTLPGASGSGSCSLAEFSDRTNLSNSTPLLKSEKSPARMTSGCPRKFNSPTSAANPIVGLALPAPSANCGGSHSKISSVAKALNLLSQNSFTTADWTTPSKPDTSNCRMPGSEPVVRTESRVSRPLVEVGEKPAKAQQGRSISRPSPNLTARRGGRADRRPPQVTDGDRMPVIRNMKPRFWPLRTQRRTSSVASNRYSIPAVGMAMDEKGIDPCDTPTASIQSPLPGFFHGKRRCWLQLFRLGPLPASQVRNCTDPSPIGCGGATASVLASVGVDSDSPSVGRADC